MTQRSTSTHLIIHGNVIDELQKLADGSVHCIVTSPPYFGLRNYGTEVWEGGDPICSHMPLRAKGESTSGLEGSTESQNHRQEGFKGDTCPKCGATKVDHQLGLEKTPYQYIERLVQIMREARRVLRDDGTLWLNLGDSYWGSWGNSGNRPQLDGESRGQRERTTEYLGREAYDNQRDRPASSFKVPGLKPKDLIGIPWMAAFALRADGWWLRSDIIWAKPNPMPESVTDRVTKSHEYIFLLTKTNDYFYDHTAIKEPVAPSQVGRVREDVVGGVSHVERGQHSKGGTYTTKRPDQEEGEAPLETRNKRSVWNIPTLPSQVSHFAVFPPQIPLNCIKASTSAHGVCSKCGAPWHQVIEDTGIEDTSAKGSKFNEGKTAEHQLGRSGDGVRTVKKAGAWEPGCECQDHQRGCPQFGVSYRPDTCSCGAWGVKIVPATVLDVFHGSGTTGAVSEYLGRRYIGIELNEEYIEQYDARSAEVRRHLIGGDSPVKASASEDQIDLFEEIGGK